MTGYEIKQLRSKLRWTQEKLAKELGIGQNHVSRIERGAKYGAPIARILKIIAEQADESAGAAQ
ncbi:helix-turn-helix domain-containing protein [uncultured Roseobacter sp.]|uniref:helix-turn-helix domain-containing protein n=1 Tax=uncultured Roseobacter sp. TaxID=114847 RepID=UPI0026396665|nr:helix-turn-helix domain-containing protein [uncultured Roseobacter sp.]